MTTHEHHDHHDDEHQTNNSLVFTVPGAILGFVAYLLIIAALVLVFR